MNDLKVETTDTFYIIGENGHKYRVFEITEFVNLEGQGWVPAGKLLRTDGWDRVEDLGDSVYRIVALSVTAKLQKD